MPPNLEERLRLSVITRALAFELQVQRAIAEAGGAGPGVVHALELFAHYASTLIRQVEQAWADAPSAKFKQATMRSLNEHLRYRIALFDTRFARGNAVVPRALTAAVERECESMSLPAREAVISVGPPANFVTFIADLGEHLFRYIQVPLELPAHLLDLKLVLISVPAIEGSHAAWQPVVVGHELAHYVQVARPVSPEVELGKAIDRSRLASTTGPLPLSLLAGSTRTRALEQIAARWLNELICDAYAVHRYGAAAFAALVEFLDSVGAGSAVSDTHPPGSLRALLMLSWLGSPLSSIDAEIASPLAATAGQLTTPDWVAYLCELFVALQGKIKTEVGTWAGGEPYITRDRTQIIDRIAKMLDMGIPGTEIVSVGLEDVDVEPADVLNACWLATHRGSTKPLNRLTLKALDTLDFIHRWSEAGGSHDQLEHTDDGPPSSGALTESELERRLTSGDGHGLVVTPWLQRSIRGASIDLRLGNKFIVFERSSAAVFDALDTRQDPRSMQTSVERSWGDVFYLHPGQLVLAATLEYLVLPADLTAQVITRSSYGRLGLISATAVQVHPYFSGCLTLELVNLGEMPMAITPGERIAQLMFFTTTTPARPPAADEDKYRFPTGPEFSKISRDIEGDVLREMRRRFDARIGRPTI